jgi:Sec-independent protein secretion pathway component TatC
MTPLTVVAVAFVLSLLLFGFAFWTPIYALPLVVLFLIGLGLAELARRRGSSRELREFRAQARNAGPHHESEFTDRDRETLYEKP